MIKVIFGNGGHAKEVLTQMDVELIRFVDDEFYEEDRNLYSISKFQTQIYEIMICVGDSKKRSDVVNKLPKETKYFTFIHPTSIHMLKKCNIGIGSFIGANSIITYNVNLGEHALLNRGNHIGHDCIIGNYFTMMPGSVVSGNCRIGDRVYIGTNSSVKENITICDDVIIGMNSGVVKNITEPGIYIGTPAIKIK